MDASVLVLVSTAITAAVASVIVCRWSYSRRITALRERLDKSEQARQAAHERSSHARQQIAQLSKAIADLQRRHMVTLDTQRKRIDFERMVPSLPESSALPASSFADTEPVDFQNSQPQQQASSH